MAVPRSLVVDQARSGLYHCCSRCVRKAFLLSSADDCRRRWIIEQIRRLCDAFAIDVVSIAVLENHMHLILRTMPELVATWNDREVAYRWLLVRPNRGRRRKLGLDPDGPPQAVEIDLLCTQARRIETLRGRLSSLSWFMKELKEPIARRANAEDGVPGRFWQDRFRCNALLDERSILCCANYVDMNPVEAGIAPHALTARFTSVERHMQRLWNELAIPTEERDRCAGSAEAMEQLASRLDDVRFGPAIPCRRESHASDEGAASPEPRPIDLPYQAEDGALADGSRHDAVFDASPALSAAATVTGAPSEACDSSHAPEPIATRISPGHGPLGCCRTPEHGPVPPVAVLNMTLGQYFRRLAELSRVLGCKSHSQESMSNPESRRSTAPQSILDGDEASLEAAATMLHGVRFWGTAVGSTASLAAEAVRRSRTRVVCAMRRQKDPTRT